MQTVLILFAAVGFVSCVASVVLLVAVAVYCWRHPVDTVEPASARRGSYSRSVADGVDWAALAIESRERHQARRRQAI